MIGKRHEYAVMAKYEEKLWWYRCLHDLTLQKIRELSFPADARILDAGCGTGGMMMHLRQNGYFNISGFDFSPDAIEFSGKHAGLNVQLLDILHSDKAYEPNSFDVIISNDILCLLQNNDDKAAFNKLVSILRPGGVLLMNLPAGKFFAGTHDIAVGITKRYSQKQLITLAGNAVKIRQMLYWPFLLSPLIMLMRIFQKIRWTLNKDMLVLSDVKMPASFLNRLFYRLTSWENSFTKTKPWGSSVFIVMQKP